MMALFKERKLPSLRGKNANDDRARCSECFLNWWSYSPWFCLHNLHGSCQRMILTSVFYDRTAFYFNPSWTVICSCFLSLTLYSCRLSSKHAPLVIVLPICPLVNIESLFKLDDRLMDHCMFLTLTHKSWLNFYPWKFKAASDTDRRLP